MNPTEHNLAVQIVCFENARFPGSVAAEFVDALDSRHTVVERWPIVSTEVLDQDSG